MLDNVCGNVLCSMKWTDSVKIFLFEGDLIGQEMQGFENGSSWFGFVGGQGIEMAGTAETFVQCEERTPSTDSRDRQW